MNIGEKIIQAREKLNITRQALADRINISYSALSKYETGLRFPDYETLVHISVTTGVSLEELLSVDYSVDYIMDSISDYDFNYKPNIQRLALKNNVDVTKLSEALTISVERLNKFANNETQLSLIELIKLADHFNCSIDYLIGRYSNNDASNPLSRHLASIEDLDKLDANDINIIADLVGCIIKRK